MMRLLVLLFLLFPFHADAQNALIYNKVHVTIIPQNTTQESKTITSDEAKSAPEAEKKPEEGADTVKLREKREYTLDLRPLDFLYQQDFIYHQPFTDANGMMFLFDLPEAASLRAANMLAMIDILFIDPEGYILRIAPNIKLNELSAPLESEKAVQAIIFLKGGSADAGFVKPGDRVEGTMFRQKPLMLEATPRPKTQIVK